MCDRTQLTNELFADALWDGLGQRLGLTDIETEVVRRRCMGWAVKEIAADRGRSEKTIGAELRRAMRRAGAGDPGEMISTMLQHAFAEYLHSRRQAR